MPHGSCLCGAVRFTVSGPLTGASDCHCGQCRKMSGHVWSSANVADGDLAVTGTPRWFESSPGHRRGFCPGCGAFLFWKALDEDTTSVALGALDGPTGVTLARHIFLADRGDYYPRPDDGAPNYEEGSS